MIRWIHQAAIVTEEVMMKDFRAIFLREKRPRIVDALKKCPVFRGLSKDQLKRISKQCYIRNYKADETIFYTNEPAYGLFVVLKGEVEIRKNRKTICTYSPVQSFGEFALIRDATRAADAIASKDTVLCYFFKEDLKSVFLAQPKICIMIYQNLLSSAVETLKHSN